MKFLFHFKKNWRDWLGCCTSRTWVAGSNPYQKKKKKKKKKKTARESWRAPSSFALGENIPPFIEKKVPVR
jgi:hypothetical protein